MSVGKRVRLQASFLLPLYILILLFSGASVFAHEGNNSEAVELLLHRWADAIAVEDYTVMENTLSADFLIDGKMKHDRHGYINTVKKRLALACDFPVGSRDIYKPWHCDRSVECYDQTKLCRGIHI